MRKITLISALSLFVFAVNVFAASNDVTKLCTFEESPIFYRLASAGGGQMTTFNPDKTGINQSDSCELFMRGNPNNYYAAAGVFLNYPTNTFYRQDPGVTIPAGDSIIIKMYIYSNTVINPALNITGILPVDNRPMGWVVADRLTTLNLWTELSFKVKTAAVAVTVNAINLRADLDKALVTSPLAANKVVPNTFEPPVGAGLVYFDEISYERVITGNNELNNNQAKVFTANRKISISGASDYSTATLFNSLGQNIVSKTFDSNCEFEVQKSGVYFVQLNGKTSKVVVK